jgi:hypothetical protein
LPVNRFQGADDGLDLRNAFERWNDACALVACLLGAVAPREVGARASSRNR